MSARLYLFGQFRWELGADRAVPRLRDKTEALIAYIALSSKGIVSRQQAAQLLWEDGKDPLASVRQSVREIKELEASLGTDLFHAEGPKLSLDLNKLWVDARVATKVANMFNAPLAEQLVHCDLGILLDTCTVTAEVFDEWLLNERTRRLDDLSHALEQLLQTLMMRAAPAVEIRHVAHSILSFDPTNERAFRAQMRAYQSDGDRASALRQFEICQEILRRDLGVEPSKETTELADQIKFRRASTVEQPAVPDVIEQQYDENYIRPVISVQEFVVAGQDPIQAFVAQTFRSDICEQLSRNDQFAVRDRGASGLATSQASSGSGSVYCISGNIIAVGDSTVILLQMLDDATGDILWMKRITPEIKKLLSGQDEQALLAAIEMYRLVELKETDKAHKIEDSLLNARQCLLRAVSIMFRFTPEATRRAKSYLHRALTQAPGYPEAMAWLAFLNSIEIGQGYAIDPAATRAEAGELVRRSIELSPGSDIGLAISGHLEAFVHHDFETALEYFERSHAANPNCAFAWGFSAITHCYVGKPDKALQLLGRCRQIMPFDSHPYYFDTARCIASMLSGRYEDAVRIGRQVLRNNPNFHANYRPLISSLGHLGRREEAEPLVHEFEKIQPDFSVSWHLANYPPLQEDLTERYVQGLLLAGVSK